MVGLLAVARPGLSAALTTITPPYLRITHEIKPAIVAARQTKASPPRYGTRTRACGCGFGGETVAMGVNRCMRLSAQVHRDTTRYVPLGGATGTPSRTRSLFACCEHHAVDLASPELNSVNP